MTIARETELAKTTVSPDAFKSTLPFVLLSAIFMAAEVVYPDVDSLFTASAIFYAIYIIYILVFCGGLRTLQATFTIALFIYSFLPRLPGVEFGIFATFTLSGASQIHSVARFANVFANYLTSLSLARPGARLTYVPRTDEFMERAGHIAASLSTMLSLLYIARNGAVGLGAVSYSDSFLQRSEAGSGVLGLAAPLAMAAAAIAFTRAKLSWTQWLPVLVCYVLMFIGLGQRKYIMIPLMILATQRMKRIGLGRVIFVFTVIPFGMILFGYFGYLRVNNILIGDAAQIASMSAYMENIGSYISGETPIVYATAAAAFDGFMDPLPYLGDYLMSWLMNVPSFLRLVSFENVNVRFSAAFTPKMAEQGGGWGFSFYGEAFMVGGFIGVFVVTTLMTLVFGKISKAALRRGANSFFGVMAACGVYHTLWTQRNSFGVILREYFVQQTACILIIFAAAAFLSAKTRDHMRQPG